jgi:xanthine dehydrogenase YagS FAD-binding subunit
VQPFSYLRADSVEQAISAHAGQSVRYLAGGTTLYDLMKLDIERPQRVIDINFLGLSQIEITEEEIILGASVRMADAAVHPVIRAEFPALSESLWKAASQQLRNMATLGGNLLQRTRCHYFRHGEPYACNKRSPGSGCAALGGLNRTHAVLGGTDKCIAVYPGDFGTALAAFDVVIDVQGPSGSRFLPFENLHVRPDDPALETTLIPGELITAIRVRRTPLGLASTYHKVRERESYAFALTSCCAALQTRDGVVEDIRLSLGGVATLPWRARAAEVFLKGKTLSYDIALKAGMVAFAEARSTEHNAFKPELGARTVADAIMIASERG